MKSLPLPFDLPLPAEHPREARLRALRVVVPSAPPLPESKTRQRRRSIWLALHFRDWPLRAALSALSEPEQEALEVQPLAVVDADRRSTVLACNGAATSLGIRAGHSMNAAIALSADTHFLPRHTAREVELLREVAELCGTYTSAVSLQPPNELTLEVRCSVRLFGGIARIVDRIHSDFKQLGLDPQIAMSSTAQSSIWVSRVAERPKIIQPRDLIQNVSHLPIGVLLWPADIELRLIRFGVVTIGDLLRLPRGGLARRIGYERLAELDRAVGRNPEVRHYYIAAESYSDPVTLDFEIETTGLLSTVIEKRMRRLQTFLTRRNLSVDGIRINLRHREQRVTPVMLGLAGPTADMHHVSQLMREQLARVQLPAPVIAFSVSVEQLHPAPEVTRELFDSAGTAHTLLARTDAQARLLEQLRAHLGESTVTAINTRADYRPELGHHASSPNLQSEKARDDLPKSLVPRPLWLLCEPRDVPSTTVRKAHKIGPERIETGWWDDCFAVRDYYRMISPHGALGWVYRDQLRSGQWRLHGLFG